MKCSRRRYIPTDRVNFEPRSIFLANALESLIELEEKENSFIETILIGDKPVFIGGMVILWRGCATLWSLSTEEVKTKPKALHKLVLEMIEEYARIFQLHRVQFNVRAEYEEGQRWARSLGFECEGMMRKYDPEGRDYLLYAKVFHG